MSSESTVPVHPHLHCSLHSVGPTLRSSPRTTLCLLTKCEQAHYISPTSWLLLPWQASPHGKVRGDAANPVISRPGRLRTSEIPIPLLVSSAVTHHRPFRDWHLFTKPVLILTEEISSTSTPRCFPVLYPISRSGTYTSDFFCGQNTFFFGFCHCAAE